MKSFSLISLLLFASISVAQTKQQADSVTKHSIKVNGRTLAYTATAGTIPLLNENAESEGHLFYVAYTKEGADPAKRPLTFAFNGGPGSSTMWLHLGGLAPKRVHLTDNGDMPPPPYKLVDNPDTWLEATDLVFIDAMGTGYSRPAKPDLGKKFYGMRPDIEAFTEFIRGYLSKNNRYGSPLFVCGESYGGIRGAGLSRSLLDRGIALNGLLVVSGVTNYATLRTSRGHDTAYIGYLPSFTATAWYHKKLDPALQAKPVEQVVRESEAFASGPYARALHLGTSMPEAERKEVVRQLAMYTGLKETFVSGAHLKVSPGRFFKELRRDEGLTVGRLDSRFTGTDALEVGDSPEYDAASSAITPVFNSAINDYLSRDLKYTSAERYRMNNYGGMGSWDYGMTGGGFPDTSEDLRRALNENPYMKVVFLCGYYDLATPFYGMKYAVDHMDLGAKQLSNVSWAYYPAGHMMYIEKACREKLKKDVAAFYESAVSK